MSTKTAKSKRVVPVLSESELEAIRLERESGNYPTPANSISVSEANALAILDRPIGVNRFWVKYFGDLNVAWVLAGCIDISQRPETQGFDRWFEMSKDEWLDFFGISYSKLLKARHFLIENGFLFEQKLTFQGQKQYRVNFEQVFSILSRL